LFTSKHEVLYQEFFGAANAEWPRRLYSNRSVQPADNTFGRDRSKAGEPIIDRKNHRLGDKQKYGEALCDAWYRKKIGV
jgi:hypothetical protein